MIFVTVYIFFCCQNVILCLTPLSTNILLYKPLDLLNVVSSPGKLLIFLDIIFIIIIIIIIIIFDYIWGLVRKNVDI